MTLPTLFFLFKIVLAVPDSLDLVSVCQFCKKKKKASFDFERDCIESGNSIKGVPPS